MNYSILASEIDREYKLKQKYKNKQRQQCVIDKKKQCEKCKYQYICEESERD